MRRVFFPDEVTVGSEGRFDIAGDIFYVSASLTIQLAPHSPERHSIRPPPILRLPNRVPTDGYTD